MLARTLNLRSAVALNMLDMIGVGPFITLPLLLGAMGGPQAMLGWIFGALLAVADGLVWAELGAAMPEAGGTYRFLRTMYPGRLGRLLAFLFAFQLLFSAPLSVASGSIGLSQYATFLAPGLRGHAVSFGRLTASPATLVAVLAVVLAVFLLYRNLAHLRVVSYVLWATVLATIAWVVVTGIVFGHWANVVSFPPGAFRLTPAFFSGLASAMLIATYDFWGYYNITFLGAEVKDPARAVPRAILLSIAFVTVLYLALNAAILAVMPWQPLLAAKDLAVRQTLISSLIQQAYGGRLGAWLGALAAVLVMVTAFASIFSLLLGYSRIPYAAARDGNFFAPFARLHPTRGFPVVSLLYLGGAAVLFCFFSLAEVIAALVVLRILVQFLLQHIGVLYLRRTQPHLARPFRLWLYPLPPVVAIAGFTYILIGRANYQRQLLLSAGIVALGALLFFVRTRTNSARQRGESQ